MKKFVLVAIGLLLVLMAVSGLWFAELGAAGHASTMAEGVASVVEADPYEIDPGRADSLVHVAGDVAAPAPMTDAEFGVAIDALALGRTVEMWQWEEYTESQSTGTGSSRRSKTVHKYRRVWSPTPIDSSSFRKGGHANPTDPYPVDTYVRYAANAKLGARDLDSAPLSRLTNWEPVAPPADADVALPEGFVAMGGGWYRGTGNPGAPAIGDVRVYLRRIPPGPYSFVGAQVGKRIFWKPMAAGGQILIGVPGLVPASAMIASAESEGDSDRWITRALYFGLLLVAIGLMTHPLQRETGRFVLAVAAAALAVSAAATAAAWGGHRLALAAGLTVVAVAAGFGAVRLFRPPAPASAPPPPR